MNRAGEVITFYSYKGGTGRTMALASVAVCLARWGGRILCLDWDLEAPGLDRFFGLEPTDRGLLDLLEDPESRWEDLVRPALPDRELLGRIDLLDAGSEHPRYAERLHAFDWAGQYQKKGLNDRVENLRDAWCRAYDFVLIDSRTGLSDMGGVSTIHLPDHVVALMTPNDQALAGTLRVMASARRQQAALPLSRRPLGVVPVLTRVDQGEYHRGKQWREKVAAAIHPWLDEQEPDEAIDVSVALEWLGLIEVPNVPYWLYGEEVPCLDGDATVSGSVERAHTQLARWIARRCHGLRDFVTGEGPFHRWTQGSPASWWEHAPPSAEGQHTRVAVGGWLREAVEAAEQQVGSRLQPVSRGLLYWPQEVGRRTTLPPVASAGNPAWRSDDQVSPRDGAILRTQAVLTVIGDLLSQPIPDWWKGSFLLAVLRRIPDNHDLDVDALMRLVSSQVRGPLRPWLTGGLSRCTSSQGPVERLVGEEDAEGWRDLAPDNLFRHLPTVLVVAGPSAWADYLRKKSFKADIPVLGERVMECDSYKKARDLLKSPSPPQILVRGPAPAVRFVVLPSTRSWRHRVRPDAATSHLIRLSVMKLAEERQARAFIDQLTGLPVVTWADLGVTQDADLKSPIFEEVIRLLQSPQTNGPGEPERR